MQFLVKDQCDSGTNDQFFIKYISTSDQEYQKSLNMASLYQKLETENLQKIDSNQDQLINSIHSIYDISTTSLKQLQNYLNNNFSLPKDNYQKLMKRIIITKRIMKRQKAKVRACSKMNKKLSEQKEPKEQEMDEQKQLKQKKRNRMSAQTSRDKKKLYMIQLQKMNKQLINERKRILEQNQQLKKRLNKLEEQKTQKPKNNFIKFLIFLGLFFFINLIKQNFLQKNNSTQTIALSKLKTDRTSNEPYIESKQIDEVMKKINESSVCLDRKQIGIYNFVICKIGKIREELSQNILKKIMGIQTINRMITQATIFTS